MADDNSELIRQALEKLSKLERNVYAVRAFVNVLCAEDGKPPLFPDDTGAGPGGGGRDPGGGGSTLNLQIKPDTFFGKRQQSAVREYLDMRKAQGDGPATPRQIYDALAEGGFPFEAKDDQTALIGIRAMLRKRSAVFVKVGKGTYGLTEWYPNVRRPKAPTGESDTGNDSDDDRDDEAEQVTPPVRPRTRRQA